MHKQHGFTLVLILLCLGILGTVFAIWSQFQAKQYNYQQARKLVVATQIYAKLYGKYLHDLDENNLYVMTGISDECRKLEINTGDSLNLSLNDLQQNFGKFKENTSPLDTKIRCTAISDNYMKPELTSTNLYNQTPCLGVSKTQSGELQAFLFWATNNVANATPLNVAQITSLKLDGGGYLDSSATTPVIKSHAGWGLDTTSPVFADIAQCGASMIAPNSVIINMQMSPEYNTQLNDSLSLSRESDNKYALGDSRNRNTAKENIYMSENGNNHAFVLNTESNVKMYAQGDKVIIENGDLTTGSLQAYEEKEPGSECSSDEVGTKARQAEPPAGITGIQVENVVCTKSKLLCDAYGLEYCWVPRKGTNIVYTDPKDPATGSPMIGMYCPTYSPTAIDGKGGFDGQLGFYEPTCKVAYDDIHGPVYQNFSGSTNCEGNFNVSFNSFQYNVLIGIASSVPTQTATLPAQTGKYLQSSVTLDDGKTYKINRGYIVDTTLPSCTDMCKTYTRTGYSGIEESISGGELILNSERYCYCGFPYLLWEPHSPVYAVKPINQVSSYLRSLTCTSKILISGD